MTIEQLFPDSPTVCPNTIQRSADEIWQSIANTYADCEQDPSKLVVYALCDLQHLCDYHGFDKESIFAEADALYAEERSGQSDKSPKAGTDHHCGASGKTK